MSSRERWHPTVMILAAGRGERMRPLTDACPKAILPVAGKPLVVWQIERLAAAGLREIVINVAHLGAAIEAVLGNGAALGVDIVYSREQDALETAGGIVAALPLLGNAPFVAASADIFSDFDYARLIPIARQMKRTAEGVLAHFVLADNPPYHRQGDFSLDHGRISRRITPSLPRLNYAGIGLFQPTLFSALSSGCKMPLFPWLFDVIATGKITGEHHRGLWINVGTPDDLAAADRAAQSMLAR